MVFFQWVCFQHQIVSGNGFKIILGLAGLLHSLFFCCRPVAERREGTAITFLISESWNELLPKSVMCPLCWALCSLTQGAEEAGKCPDE